MDHNKQKRVVVIGAGFGGLWVTKVLANKNFEVIVIDKNNYHTFLPLLYQVSAAEVSPEQIAAPVRSIVHKNKNIQFIRGEVSEIRYATKTVVCLGQEIAFDYLVVSAGSVNHYFNIPGTFEFAFPLKTLDDAMVLRNHILTCFERASFVSDHVQRQRLLTIVIVGGGPTGVEFAGALAELIAGPLKKDFPELKNENIQVYLVEASDRLIGMYAKELCEYTCEKLQKKGVKVLLNAAVTKIDATGVYLNNGTMLPTETVVWTAGVKGELIKNDLKVQSMPNGRVVVDEYCRVPGYEDVFIIGDLACFIQDGKPLPMIAPVAMQQGKYVGNYLKKIDKGKNPKPFRYLDKGGMVAIGRNKAITQIAGLKLKGYIAWIIWIFIHILYLIGFKNKIFVMINWVWSYIFFEKSVRLILPRCCDDPHGKNCLQRGRSCRG
ncbi:MAG: NAD(P)/FAD-dependent oxidoreductase [Spirochaetes bacterium]|nr:NAD(P)/FAD-dependent oxidoreductase [Spirochaetota bacterium]